MCTALTFGGKHSVAFMHRCLCLSDAPLYFTNHYYNNNWKSWRIITYAFVGYSLQALSTLIFFCAYLMDRYLMYHYAERTILNPRDIQKQSRAAQMFGYVEDFDYRRDFYKRAESVLGRRPGEGPTRGHVRNLGSRSSNAQRQQNQRRSDMATPLLSMNSQ